MVRRIILLFLIIFIPFSCKKKYSEFNAYPSPGSIAVQPGEKSFIALKVEMPAGHYIYGNPKGPGTGRETAAGIKSGTWGGAITFGEARFLNPEKHLAKGEKEYTWIYSSETLIFIPFAISGKAVPGTHKIPVNLDILMCNDSSCIPKNFDMSVVIEISADKNRAAVYSLDIIEQFKGSRPPSDRLKSGTGDGPLKNTVDEKKDEKRPLQAELINETFTPRFMETSSVAGILEAIIFGLIAGFILNFMPCVLPVVSLKVMSFMKYSGKDRGQIARQGIVFSLGIITSFIGLAVLAAFFGHNWGDLFQYSLFIIILASIIFALALSMFEIFTINAPSFIGRASKNMKNPYADAYFKGLLATAMATPCSGPFLGGTLAWTLAQPAATIFIIFVSIGTGMAAPYIFLSFKPDLINRIPKPGEWTRTFEAVMGFLLLFTVIYLITILEEKKILPMVTYLAFIALAFWQFGKYGSLANPGRRRLTSSITLIVLLTVGYLFSFNYLYVKKETGSISLNNFSLERLRENRDKGIISMVKFTADWCPNCKLVEKLSLETPMVENEMLANRIDFIKADLTHGNIPARELLVKLQSRSIPFLAVFPAGKHFENPVCLRDMYSEKDVLKAIAIAVKKGEAK